MTRPKHRRCQVCHTVTARYLHTQKAGAVTVRVWASSNAGEVLRRNGTETYCARCAPREVAT